MAELALKGGKKAKHRPFPLWPQFDDRERKALEDVLQSRVWWRTPGTKTLEFEKEFARFHGKEQVHRLKEFPASLVHACLPSRLRFTAVRR